jgi:nucleoid-associated protein YgaU
MIFIDSRYANGWAYRAKDSRTGLVQNTVRRTFPTYNAPFYTYTWIAGDRIDQVAHKSLGNSTNWWMIMDMNPELTNPFAISPGTVIRIPRV